MAMEGVNTEKLVAVLASLKGHSPEKAPAQDFLSDSGKAPTN